MTNPNKMNQNASNMSIEEVIHYIKVLQHNNRIIQPEVVSAINKTIKILDYIKENLILPSCENTKALDNFIDGLYKISNTDISEIINYMNALRKSSIVMIYEIRLAIDRAIAILRYVQESIIFAKQNNWKETSKFVNGLYKICEIKN